MPRRGGVDVTSFLGSLITDTGGPVVPAGSVAPGGGSGSCAGWFSVASVTRRRPNPSTPAWDPEAVMDVPVVIGGTSRSSRRAYAVVVASPAGGPAAALT